MQQFIDELSSQKTYSNSRLTINDFPGVVVFAPHFCGAFFPPPVPSLMSYPFLAHGKSPLSNGLPIYVELSPSDKGTLNSSYLYPVKKMSFFDAFKLFGDAPIEVTCPECAKSSPQNRSKVKKNVTLICPHCGHYFRKRED
ncbi:TPA: YnfU family zinc-binding protein [Serratia fonticola]